MIRVRIEVIVIGESYKSSNRLTIWGGLHCGSGLLLNEHSSIRSQEEMAAFVGAKVTVKAEIYCGGRESHLYQLT